MTASLQSIQAQVRQILREQRTVRADIDALGPDSDLYAAGLTSLSSVDLMLAIEQSFDLVFPDEALNRRTFASIASIAVVVERLKAGTAR